MELRYLLDYVNLGTEINLYDEATGELIMEGGLWEEMYYDFGDREVTDIFVDNGSLAVEIKREEEED